MKINLKKVLLTGTALVAVGTFGAQQAHAAAATLVATPTIWAGAGTQAQIANDGTDAAAGDTANVATFTLTVNNDAVADDGGGAALFTLGAVTGTTGSLLISSDVAGTTAGDTTANGTTITLTGAGNVTVQNLNDDDAAVAATFSGAISTGGNLAVTNNEASAAKAVSLAAQSTLSVTGTTDVTAGTLAAGGDTAALTVTGNATLTGAVTITAGANHANNTAILTLNGVTNTLTAGATLDDNTGLASIVFDGGAAQAVTGTIDGDVAGEGTIVVSNTGGTTFNSAVGGTAGLLAINLSKNATGTSATFKDDVSATNIAIGDGGGAADAYTVTLDGTGGAFAVTGLVDGAATDTATVAVSGGNTITAMSDWGSGSVIEAVTLSGAGTGLTFDTTKNLTATTVTVGAGTTLTLDTGIITGAVNISGAAGALVFGDVNGTAVSGAVNNTSGGDGVGAITAAAGVGSTTTFAGAIGATNSLSSITLSDVGELAFSGTVDATTITASVAGTLTFADAVTGAINLAADATVDLTAGGITVTGAINNTSGGDGAGTIDLTGGAGTTITGAVGATNSLKLINLGAAGTDAFGAAVKADDIIFTDASTATFAGSVTGDIDFDGNDGVITLASGMSITGTVDDGSGGGPNGTLTLSGGTQTISGAIGATNELLQVNAGANSAVSTFSGTVDAADIDVTGTGSVTFADDVAGNLNFAADGSASIAAGKNITGPIDNTTGLASKGTMTFAGATTGITTIGATNVLKALTLSGSATTVAASGAVKTALTTTLGTNTLTAGGTATTLTGQTIATTLSSATALGHITATGNAVVVAGTLVDVTIPTSIIVETGTEFTVIGGAAAGASVATLTAGNITDDSLMVSFTQKADADNLILVAARDGTSVYSTSGNNTAVGAVLDALGSDGTGVLDTIQANLNAATTQQQINDILESVIPTTDGGSVVAALGVSNATMDMTGQRLAMLRTGDNSTGIAAGNVAMGVSTWGQVFGNSARQDHRDGVDGYDSRTWGLALGMDTKNWIDDATLGIAFSYGRTNVDSNNANTTQTDVGTFQATLYGDFSLSDKAYLNGMAAYAYNNNDTTRHAVGGVGGPDADGNFGANQYTVRAEAGRDYAYGSATLTPSVMANWMHYTPDSYTETGTGANLHVDGDSLNMFEVGLGLNASWLSQNASGSYWQPSLHAGVRHDLVGDKVVSTNNFTGGGAAFRTEGFDPAQTMVDAGAGLKYYSTANWEFTANYDYELKADYGAHSGYLRAAYKF